VILAAVPLRRMNLYNWEGYGALAQSPLLSRIRELVIVVHDYSEMTGGQFDDGDVTEILRLPVAELLTHLELEGHDLTPEGMRALAKAHLPQLRFLTLGEPRWGPDGQRLWEPLLAADWLGRLEGLSVERHPLPAKLVAPLCAKLCPGPLGSLTLREVGLDDAAAADLVRSGLLERVADLQLPDNEIGPAGARLLSDGLPDGARLVLDGNRVTDGGLEALAGSPLLQHLLCLEVSGPSPAGEAVPGAPRPYRGSRVLSDPALDSRAVMALAASPHARLRSLTLTGGVIGSEAIRAILTSPQLAALDFLSLGDTLVEALPACHRDTLRYLALVGNRLHDAGLEAFCTNSRLPALEVLCLGGNRLGPRAAAALAGASGFNALETLRLSHNPLGDDGAKALGTGSGLTRLSELDLTDCGIGDVGGTALVGSPLLCRLKSLRLKSARNPISAGVYLAIRESATGSGCRVD
jgi:hypothetical protein